MINFSSLIASTNIGQDMVLGHNTKANVRKKAFPQQELEQWLMSTNVDPALFSLASERTDLTKFSICGLPSEQTQRVVQDLAANINDMFGPNTVAYIDDREDQIRIGNIVARTANMRVDDRDDNLAPVT